MLQPGAGTDQQPLTVGKATAWAGGNQLCPPAVAWGYRQNSGGKCRHGVQGLTRGPAGGLAVAWRLSSTWAWPRVRDLLQGRQVSPGAAGTQAHLQGHLWVAARGEHQAWVGHSQTPPRPHGAQADTLQTDAQSQGQADRLTPRSHALSVWLSHHLTCQDQCVCRGGARQGALPVRAASVALLPGGLAGPERCQGVLPRTLCRTLGHGSTAPSR